MADKSLSLQEELLLLWIEPRSGRLKQPYLRYALAGAALAELLLQKRMHLDDTMLRVRQTTPIGDEAIDVAFRRFPVTVRPRKATWWVRNFYSSAREPLDIAASRLVERGILTRDERSALWVIHWTDYPVLEPAYSQKLRRQVRDAILKDDPVDAHLAVLIALMHNVKGLDAVLDRSELAEREHRIVAICASQAVGYTVGKAIAAVVREDEEVHERVSRHIIIIERGRRRSKPRRPKGPPRFPGPPPKDNEPWRYTNADTSATSD